MRAAMSTTITIWPANTPLALDDLAARLAAPDGEVIWADIIGPADEDVSIMRDVFHFHPLAIEDTRNARQRPKVEEYANYLFLILNPIARQESLFCELDVFVGANYVVTVHADDEPVIAEVRRRLSRGNTSMPITPGYLMYLFIDAVVDGYFPTLDSMEEEIEGLGDQILTNPSQAMLNNLFDLKKTLVDMWRVVWPQREILNNLRDHNLPLISQDQLMPYLRDVSDHLMWIADMISTFRDTLTSIMDLYMSAVSNRLNTVVNRLTVFTVIIGLLTVFSGFYGMNFEHTWPPFSATLGIPFVILLMIAVTAVLLVVFRRLKWY
jgi:magnesium transporter